MNKIFFLLIFCIPGLTAFSQQNAAETAKQFMKKGDYNNAILVLNRAIESDRDNIEIRKDLAFAYYLQRDYTKALSAIRPLTDSNDGDAQSYQIIGMIYKGLENTKEAEKYYRSGLKKFPQSGALFNEYGELLWSNAEFPEAAAQWLKGIQKDPNYPGNYFNVSRYYYMSADKV